MLLEDCSWESVEQRLVRDRRIVLVLGATEQHSDLSVAADTRIPYVIARRACELEDALLAPPLPFGISAWSMAYPGTISLRTSTLAAVVEDIVRSLATAGFRQFFVLNGHGFNRAVAPVFGEAIGPFAGSSVKFHQWWELDDVRAIAGQLQVPFGHATWAEAFPFTVLGERRRAQPTSRTAPNLLQPPEAIRTEMGAGHGPGPLHLGAGVECRLIDAAIASFRKILAAPCSS